MSEAILTLNAGSSSLKFALFEHGAGDVHARIRGQVEGIGARARLRASRADGAALVNRELDGDDAPADARAALAVALAWLESIEPDTQVTAVGHRVVHGGPRYAEPVFIDEERIAELERFVPLAPLHQPHNLAGIRVAVELFPEAVQVACFDTAFHRAHPFVNDAFALPLELYEEGVRRYGFHGLSYEYVVGALAQVAPHHATGRVVVMHLGNGASMCAVRDGHSVGSTMGFSALDGLPMGTRCGQIDPGVLLYLLDTKGMTSAELSDLLYKRSGLLGLSGVSHDMRELEASAAPEAAHAIDYFVFRIRRELGAMAAILGGVDAIVFTGGIGENARNVRERVCSGLEWLGVELDSWRNRANETVISSDRSRCRVLVVPTDEETVIARHADRLLAAGAGAGAQPRGDVA